MKSYLLAGLLWLSGTLTIFAGEGMWLPLLLSELNESEMRAMGMKMTAEDIYSINKGSLKDAIVHFGGFCTGEVISSEGLVLTNHHCGYGQIQSHSSLENNYLEDGFWAMDKSEELSNPGLFVTFIVRIEDITEKVLGVLSDDMSEADREGALSKIYEQIKAGTPIEEYQDIRIRPFFHGNQYFLFVTETYNDVRLVGAPPSSIGKFGADTDNWEWPRHTGDFSLFRIYTGPDGKPAEYSEDNIPMKPRYHLPVSLDGVAEGDFTLVFGFPGRTDEYLPSVAIQQRVEMLNPTRVQIRDRSLKILDQAMRKDPSARIQYASKQSRIANAWKKWKGESQGIEAVDGIGKRKMMEQEFTAALEANSDFPAEYSKLLPQFEQLYSKIAEFAYSRAVIEEIVYRNVELFRLTTTLKRYVNILDNNGEEALKERLPRLTSYLEGYYKDYNADIDQEIATAVLKYYYKGMPTGRTAPFAADQFEYAGNDMDVLVNKIYSSSYLTKGDRVLNALAKNPVGFIQQVKGDYAYQYIQEILTFSEGAVFDPYREVMDEINQVQRQYMAALMEVFPDRRFYPDANSTMRVTYGKVEGYTWNEEQTFDYSTYLDGVIDKYVPGDYEFDVPEKLRTLHSEKDYGQYADQEGRLPVCFLGSNHTTGGNSGSPAIDASGNLVGLNFDRTWHSTMSDVNYDPSICRNIMVDARYILFIIDKFAGAGHLVEEMTLVNPKS
ncbi:MAG: S46 family peptidase [Bacteroidota bacterium]